MKIEVRNNFAAAVIASYALQFASFHSEAGNAWVLVDDFQYQQASSVAHGVGQAPDGSIYAVGYGVSNTVQRALTRKSTDGGTTWTLVDDFAYPGAGLSRFYRVSADDVGNVFVVGQANISGTLAAGGGDHWIVRRSSDGGTTWATVDDYFGPGIGAGAWPNGVMAQHGGAVYVVGQGDTALSISGKRTNYANDWIVRRSLDEGATWTTVDDYEFAPGVSGGISMAESITSSAAGLFAVGWARQNYWIVRWSPTGNHGSWSTVDVYTNSSGLSVFPYAAGVDANGSVYAAGFYDTGRSTSYYDHWLVRRSTNGGLSWTTVDNLASQNGAAYGFALDAFNDIVLVGIDDSANSWMTRNSTTGDPGTWLTTDEYQSAAGYDVCRDSAGNLFAVGIGIVSGGPQHWLVRKQTP